MGYYHKATGRTLRSHDFRRAAFTRAAEAGIHPKLAGVAFDVTPETMLRYYTATEKKKIADEVLGGLADKLLPKNGKKRSLSRMKRSDPTLFQKCGKRVGTHRISDKINRKCPP
jgi:hypothetical protein